jgi:penicillin G amidase
MPRQFPALLLLSILLSGCAAGHLLSYGVKPNYPVHRDGKQATLPGLTNPVQVSLRPDGVHRIEAQTEHDLFFAQGYLQARDRMFQLDFIRRMAKGELASLLGDVDMGAKTALETDIFNRFIGFAREAQEIYETLEAEERLHLDAFAAGVNAWMEQGRLSLEHRLLGAQPYPWHAADSLAIFRFVMFGMTHNYTREIRRLLIACDAGFDAMERIWPSFIEFDAYFLPAEAVPAERYPVLPAVAPELRDALPGLCPSPVAGGKPATKKAGIFNPLQLFEGGIQASNNWVVAGSRTETGRPIMANDPHLPHLNPPIVWPIHQVLPDYEAVGFTMVGTHRIFVGHNFSVAWGSTINNVDLQDLYVEKPMTGPQGEQGYESVDGFAPFEVRHERFTIKGGDEVEVSARFTRNGPLLNDLDAFLAQRIPLTALRTIDVEGAGDGIALREAAKARNGTEFVAAMHDFDSACISWVFADTEGNIGWTSPCRVPVRGAHSGTFPAPGWVADYQWKGYLPKEELPQVWNPEQGWIATANNQPLPFDRFPTTYNNDASPPNRYQRIADGLQGFQNLSLDDMAALQMDTGLADWPHIQKAFQAALCDNGFDDALLDEAAGLLCAWDGDIRSESPAATIFIYVTHAILDRAMADELSGGAEGEVWHYLQAIPHFETNVDRFWHVPATDAVWNDVRTEAVETRDDIYRAAFADAAALMEKRFGKSPAAWRWGDVRPFVLTHFFGGQGGIVGRIFNAPPLAGTGAPESVFKNQFLRSDRERMHLLAGPALRFIADLDDLRNSRFSLAGGAGGWPRSPHYGDLLEEWMRGETRPLTPRDNGNERAVTFVPSEPAHIDVAAD